MTPLSRLEHKLEGAAGHSFDMAGGAKGLNKDSASNVAKCMWLIVCIKGPGARDKTITNSLSAPVLIGYGPLPALILLPLLLSCVCDHSISERFRYHHLLQHQL
jgi:hypothetical protein